MDKQEQSEGSKEQEHFFNDSQYQILVGFFGSALAGALTVGVILTVQSLFLNSK